MTSNTNFLVHLLKTALPIIELEIVGGWVGGWNTDLHVHVYVLYSSCMKMYGTTWCTL